MFRLARLAVDQNQASMMSPLPNGARSYHPSEANPPTISLESFNGSRGQLGYH